MVLGQDITITIARLYRSRNDDREAQEASITVRQAWRTMFEFWQHFKEGKNKSIL